jgi:hypothetical protein
MPLLFPDPRSSGLIRGKRALPYHLYVHLSRLAKDRFPQIIFS